MDDSVRPYEPVEAASTPPQDMVQNGPNVAQLEEVLDRIVDGYRQNSGRVIQEARRPVEVMPHDLDAVVARLRAEDMNKRGGHE